MGPAPVAEDAEGLLPVEVVTVDDGERLVDDVLGHQDRMGGAPGLHAFGVEGEAGGDLVQLLGDEDEFQGLAVHGLHAGVLGLDRLFHVGLKGLPDDIDDFAESGFHGIVDGIVDDGFTVGAEAVHLLESAIAAAHAGSQDKKGRFHSRYRIF